jgi:hypothetical protein
MISRARYLEPMFYINTAMPFRQAFLCDFLPDVRKLVQASASEVTFVTNTAEEVMTKDTSRDCANVVASSVGADGELDLCPM